MLTVKAPDQNENGLASPFANSRRTSLIGKGHRRYSAGARRPLTRTAAYLEEMFHI